jgi:hypothetical protein
VPVGENDPSKTFLSAKPVYKPTYLSTIEIEKCTIWKGNEIGHGDTMGQWIILNV